MALGAVITAVKRQVSKNSQKEFARLNVEDFSGSAEVLVFPEAWSVLADRIRTDIPVLIKGGYGRRDQDNEKPTFIVDEVIPLAERRTNGAVIVLLQLRASAGLSPAVMEDIRAVAESHPGTAPLEVSWIDGRGSSSRFRSRTLTMAADGAALTELRALLGHERVRLVRGH
jgi:DNA polymerase-3 subunit alpha